MRKGIYLLPNTITICGMFFGFYCLIAALNGQYTAAAWAVVIASFFDGLDGWVARRTHTTSKFGIELDSLSDVITFGVAPSVLFYKWALEPFGRFGWAAAFLYVAFGSLRLARYNVQMDSVERKFFTGMPIPGAAGIGVATVLFQEEFGLIPDMGIIMLVMVFILAVLMVTSMKFHSVKEINVSKRKPFGILVGLVLLIALLITHPEATLFGIGMLYLGVGFVENIYLFINSRLKRGQTA